MSSSAELTLGCKYRPMVLSGEAREFMLMEDQLKHRQQLEDHIKALEEERQKIDAFKRELPLCMQLLHEAIQGSKHHLAELQTTSSKNSPINLEDQRHGSENPVLEEFLPLKCQKEKPKVEDPPTKSFYPECGQSKPSWMVEAQTCNDRPRWADDIRQKKTSLANYQNRTENLWLESNQACSPRSKFILSGGAFSPFVRGKQWEAGSDEISGEAKLTLSSGLNHIKKTPVGVFDEVAASRVRGVETHVAEVFQRHSTSVAEKGSRGGNPNPEHEIAPHAQRKARRCWSPELHRRFLSALDQLGGSRAATPKQIRELMKVDGLTNDEVKSHLQKYRLHTRRSSPGPLPASSPSAQLVLLGGIWMPPDYAAVAAAAQTNSDSVPTPSYFTTFAKESLSHLQSSAQEELHQPLYFDQNPASQSKASSHGHDESACPQGSSEGCGEASIGNDVKSDSSNRKSDPHAGTQCFRDTRICRINVQGFAAREQLEEDDDGAVTEAEDSRGSHNIEANQNDGHAN